MLTQQQSLTTEERRRSTHEQRGGKENEAHDDKEEDESQQEEWAREMLDAAATSNDLPAPEEEESDDKDPQGLIQKNVVLRPYQRRALRWMVRREEERAFEAKTSRELAELARQFYRDRYGLEEDGVPPSSSRIRDGVKCDCGPVRVCERTAQESTTIDGKMDPGDHPLWRRRFLLREDGEKVVSFYVNEVLQTASAHPPNPPRPCRGGILADAMGMGKTVMLIALIQRFKEIPVASPDVTVNHAVSPTCKGGTLVVAPLSLLSQWEHEISTKSHLSHFMHYGDTRATEETVRRSDVIVTSYGMIQSEFLSSSRTNITASNTIHLASVCWNRIILDEAHLIKNPQTIASKAASKIHADRRWAVTGTPIQNSLQDAFGLLKFLHHEPWCEARFWKNAISDLIAADKKKVEENQEQKIDNDGMKEAIRRVRMIFSPIMLRRTKDSTDENGFPILQLPPVEATTITVRFTDSERLFYDELFSKSQAIFQGFLRSGTASKKWFSIFSLLQRLRQACNHVALTAKINLEKPKDEEETHDDGDTPELSEKFVHDLLEKFCQSDTACSSSREGHNSAFCLQVAQSLNQSITTNSEYVTAECPLCLECPSIHNIVYTPCAHMFCRNCLLGILSQQNGKARNLGCRVKDCVCPVCMDTFCMADVISIHKSEEGETISTNLASMLPNTATTKGDQARDFLIQSVKGGFESAKQKSILKSLDDIWKLDPGSNVVIFSQFLGFLNFLSSSFQAKNIEHYRLDGQLTLKQRCEVLQQFSSAKKNPATLVSSGGEDTIVRGSVLLISMKAGGVGLNLVCASTVFIADPWWNAAVEDQCINRIHRLGQMAKVVRVRKFVVENSVEEQIVTVQRRKKDLCEDLLEERGSNGNNEEVGNGNPTLDDFRLMFRPTAD
uniref:Uncharacterized protein n=1 Tax=Corethron hystrix TaxID=216773 RepID=A0A7S1BPX1_9STRA